MEVLTREEVADISIIKAEIIEDGRAVGILLRESDGTVSAVRISVDQLAD